MFESFVLRLFCKSSLDDELRSLRAGGLKPLCSLVLDQWILLYILPDGSRVNRLWLGWVLSSGVLWAL